MREKLERFMTGRYGSDNLNRMLSALVCVLLILSLIKSGAWSRLCLTLSIIGMVLVYFRMLSRNVSKRRAENTKYLAATSGLRSWVLGLRERWVQRKEYKFFRCPSCHTLLRVPRGKGKLKIVCRKCGSSFYKST